MSLTYDHQSMSTGFADIDEQHKELITRLGTLLDGMHAGRGQAELLPLLDFLADYTVEHFSNEEGCMARVHCPLAAANKAAHTRFLGTVASFRRRLEREGATVALVLQAQRELADWVRTHIVRTDVHLRSCVAPTSS